MTIKIKKKPKSNKSFSWRNLVFFLMQFILIFWIIGCLYVWLVLEFATNPGLIIIRQVIPPKVVIILEKSRELVWPYVWKDYIYTQK